MVILADTWRLLGKQLWPNPEGENLYVMGTTTVEVKFNKQIATLPVVVFWLDMVHLYLVKIG